MTHARTIRWVMLVASPLLLLTGSALAAHAVAHETGHGTPADSAAAAKKEAQHYAQLGATAAGKDRHEAAIFYYRKAAALDPGIGATIGRSFGHQYTWADRPDSAVIWYRAYLDAHPDDMETMIGLARAYSWNNQLGESLETYERILALQPDNPDEVRVAMARVTSWQNRLDDAIAEYDSVLVGSPEYLDARLGRAQSVNWSGKHRQAAVLYSDVLASHPDNNEARVGLAQAYRWMGRSDRAIETVGESPAPGDGASITSAIADEHAPAAGYTFNTNQDSDDVRRRYHEFRGAFSRDYLTRGVGYLSEWRITQPQRADVDRTQIKASLARRFSDLLYASAALGWEGNRYDLAAMPANPEFQEDFNLFLLDAHLMLTPRDWVRTDFGLYHGALDNPEPIYRGISITELSAGLDYRFRHTMMAVAALSFTDYSDGNRRWSVAARYVWNPIWRVPMPHRNRFTLTTNAGMLFFAKQLGHGYYDPADYVTFYERAEWNVNFQEIVFLTLGGRIGLERDDAHDWYWTGALDGAVGWNVVRGLTLKLGYYNSQSRLETRSGYQADGWYLGADYRF